MDREKRTHVGLFGVAQFEQQVKHGPAVRHHVTVRLQLPVQVREERRVPLPARAHHCKQEHVSVLTHVVLSASMHFCEDGVRFRFCYVRQIFGLSSNSANFMFQKTVVKGQQHCKVIAFRDGRRAPRSPNMRSLLFDRASQWHETSGQTGVCVCV